MAAKLDRASRSVHDFYGLLERARREGWGLVVVGGVDVDVQPELLLTARLRSLSGPSPAARTPRNARSGLWWRRLRKCGPRQPPLAIRHTYASSHQL
ncbi:MAG TPA: hypothetical protein VMV23_01860 [Candidatus Nanopelagicaceae bacterium]|nr:hypothetical protein [Candidatus Nanopelagicaceae bacterium]